MFMQLLEHSHFVCVAAGLNMSLQSLPPYQNSSPLLKLCIFRKFKINWKITFVHSYLYLLLDSSMWNIVNLGNYN